MSNEKKKPAIDQNDPQPSSPAPRPKDETVAGPATTPIQINVPPPVDLSAFASEMDDDDEVASVEQLQGPLNIKKFQEIKDYVWVHPDPAYTSTRPYFLVDVPSDEKGGKPSLHLILKTLAHQYLDSSEWTRLNFALASMPGDRFFLGIVPCRNLDNAFNASMLVAIEQAKQGWRRILRVHGKDGYYAKAPIDPDFAQPPTWPSASLAELVDAHFSPHRKILTPEHPGLLRVLGARQRID